MILKNRPITRHYQMLQKMAKRVQGCMAGIAHDDVVENFDFEKLPTRMRSRVFFMSASDGVGSPLGWLCAMMIAAALAMTANRKISLG